MNSSQPQLPNEQMQLIQPNANLLELIRSLQEQNKAILDMNARLLEILSTHTWIVQQQGKVQP